MLLLLAACQTDLTESKAAPSITDSEDTCIVELLSSWPPDQGQDVPTNAVLTLSYAEKIPKLGVQLSADYGDYVEDHPVDTSWDGTTLVITPTIPLAPSTPYHLHINTCAGTDTIQFATEPDPKLTTNITGYTYAIQLDLPTVTWVEPAGLGSLLLSFYEAHAILFSVQNQSDTQLDLIAASAWNDPLEQYPCTDPIDMPPTDFSNNPFFETRMDQTTSSFGDDEFIAYQLALSGKITSDGESIADLRLSAMVDTTGMEETYGIDICNTAACTPCPEAADHACISLIVTTPEIYRANEIFVERFDEDDFPECP